MTYKKNIFLFILLSLTSMACFSVDVVQCENTDGHREFYTHCPPGTSLISTKSFQENKKVTEQIKLEVVHYYTTECGACDQVTDFFKLRKIDVTEKNVTKNIELQAELNLLAGELRVPTIVIGKEVLQGFNRKKMLEALTNAGWKDKEDKNN